MCDAIFINPLIHIRNGVLYKNTGHEDNQKRTQKDQIFSELSCHLNVSLNKEVHNGREMNFTENCAVVHWSLVIGRITTKQGLIETISC
jgi:hypothetical protein